MATAELLTRQPEPTRTTRGSSQLQKCPPVCGAGEKLTGNCERGKQRDCTMQPPGLGPAAPRSLPRRLSVPTAQMTKVFIQPLNHKRALSSSEGCQSRIGRVPMPLENEICRVHREGSKVRRTDQRGLSPTGTVSARTKPIKALFATSTTQLR